MNEPFPIEYAGQRYEAVVPDTLDLTDRAALAINGIGGSIDAELRYHMYFSTHLCTLRPHQCHWASADSTCDPKFGESFPLMRLMSGGDQHADLESGQRAELLSRVQDGLYWDYFSPDRPWRNSYAVAFYGKGKEEDFSVVAATGRMIRAMLVWREAAGSTALDPTIREMVAGMRRVAVCRDDYCYYPEKGGWGEPCTYPRSGWINTDEPQSETEGGEGSIVAYHGHQIYAAAHWYALTGDPVALDLCQRLTRFCLKPKFWGGLPDPRGTAQGLPGHIAQRLPEPAYSAGQEQGHWYSHFHARAIALRGMLEYARIAGDLRVLEFVQRSFEFTLSQGIPRTGWVNCYPAALNAMEGCALGDFVALGIRLSDAGLGDYWDDVDALVRNQLVEQQLTRADLLEKVVGNFTEPDDCQKNALPRQVNYDNVIARSIGVFAGIGQPNGVPNPWVMHCCTGNATQGLYYAWEGIVRESGDVAQVDLLLNRASRLLDIDSYLPFEGKVVLRNKAARRISLRVPFWVSRRELRAEVSGTPRPLDCIGQYLVFNDLKPGDVLTVTFPVPETTARYAVNANSPKEQAFTCTFRGSTVVDISPRDESPTSLPFYQRDHLRKSIAPMKSVQRFVSRRIVSGW